MTRSDKVTDAVTHTLLGPVIVPADGAVLTAIFTVAVAEPQELVTV